MEDRFNRFIEVILLHEGGYVNDPDDLGGETNFGITKRRYPDLDIQSLTVDQAKEIYFEDFFLEMKLEFIKDDLLALHVFDMGINAGRKAAVRILQELFPGIKRDGSLGPVTGLAIANASAHVDLVNAYVAKRVQRYYNISTLRNNKKFLKGWVNRVHSTRL